MDKTMLNNAFEEQKEEKRNHALRDHFAALAMNAILSDGSCYRRTEPSEIAQRAYQLADAMLVERARKEKSAP
jgi:hypothetical protein